jgi:hypothetical protein
MSFKARFGATLTRTLSVALCIGLAGAALPAFAQEPLHLSLNYDGSLYVKVLDVSVDQVLDGKAFQASAHIKTSGILSMFRKINLRAQTEGRLERDVPLPKTFSYLNNDGHKNRQVTATWSPTDVATRSSPQFPNMGDPPATREQKLEAADPLTILTRMTLLPSGEKPCQGVSQFYDGKQRYDVEYSYRGAATPDARERKLGITSAVRCSLTYREVAGFKKKPLDQRNQGLRRDVSVGLGRIGAGGPWVISFLRADTFLGAAEIDLVNARVDGARAGDQLRAGL